MSDMQAMSHESSGICWCGPNNHGPEGPERKTARATLDHIRGQLAAITPGKWKAWNRGIGYEVHSEHDEPINIGHRETFTKADAEFISAAPTDVARLIGAVEAVVTYPGIEHGVDADARFANGYNEALKRVRAAVENALTP